MPRLLLAAALSLALAACATAPETGPPEGWEADGPRWFRSGADTSGMFRDLSTLEAMGVEPGPTELSRWAQGELLSLYRTNPEVFDSVFQAVALPALREGIPAGADYEARARRAVEDAKRDFRAVYRQSIVNPEGQPARVYPDSLRQRGVGGRAVVQVYVDAQGDAQAVELVESTGNATLDGLALREAALTDYTGAWAVRGRRGGQAIPNWVRLNKEFSP
ncbi:MAG: TonB family protein [Rubricoccaceae bacterium]